MERVRRLLRTACGVVLLALPLSAQQPTGSGGTGPTRDPNAATRRATHDPAPQRRPTPSEARRTGPDRNRTSRRAIHDPKPKLAPLVAWQFLERNNLLHARRRADRDAEHDHAAGHEPHGHPDGPPPLPRPSGAGRYVCAVVTCADIDVDLAALFGLTRSDVLVLRLPGAFVTPETTALLERTITRHRLSLVLVLGHAACGALQPSGRRKPDALDRRLHTLRARATRARTPLVDALVRRQRELLLASSEHLQALLRDDYLRVVPGVVDERTGRVQWRHRRAQALPLAPVR